MADPEATKGQDVGGDVDPALLSEEEGLAYMDALRASLAGNIAGTCADGGQFLKE